MESEIEVTWEMIEAGVRELRRHIADDVPRVQSDQEIVEALLRASLRAKLLSDHHSKG